MYTIEQLCNEIIAHGDRVIDLYSDWVHFKRPERLAKTKAQLEELEATLDKLNARVVYARLVLEWDMQKHGVTAGDAD